MEFLDSAQHLGKLLVFISQLPYLFRPLLQKHTKLEFTVSPEGYSMV